MEAEQVEPIPLEELEEIAANMSRHVTKVPDTPIGKAALTASLTHICEKSTAAPVLPLGCAGRRWESSRSIPRLVWVTWWWR